MNRVAKILEFPENRQVYDYDCGANAVLSVLQYYGYDGREDKIMEISKTDEDGVDNEGICKALDSFGLEFEAKEGMTVEEVKGHIDNLRPVILCIQAHPDDLAEDLAEDESSGHYVVAIGYEGDTIVLEDPSSCNRASLTIVDLVERWHDEAELRWGVAVFGNPVYRKDKIVPLPKLERSAAGKPTRVDMWYDRNTKSWVVQLKDERDDQIGDAVYVATKTEAEREKRLMEHGIEREAAISSRVARDVFSTRVVVDENYVKGLKHMMASDIRVLERDINSPEDAARMESMVKAVRKKWEDVFYQVMLSKEMAKLSEGGKESYWSEKLRSSAWNAVIYFPDISRLSEWPHTSTRYRDNFNREKQYVFDKIKRYAREAYEDALALAQSRTEEEKTFDFGETTTVGRFVLVPESGIQEDQMRKVAELIKQAQSLIGQAGFDKVLGRMVVHVTALSKSGLVAGEYQPKDDSMNILPLGIGVHTVVHELGHRNWYQVLSAGDRAYWRAAFEGDLTEITKADVEDIIERARKLKESDKSLFSSIEGAIAAYVSGHKEDPLVPYKAAYFKDNVHIHDDFDFWANAWRKDLVGQKVMRNFVTDYANTNEQEAYAEVFMHYVMRKPIPDVVLYWFRQVSM